MQKNKKIKRKPYFNYYVLTIIATIFVMILIFNDFGLKAHFKLKNQHKALETELQQLLLQQDKLRLEIN